MKRKLKKLRINCPLSAANDVAPLIQAGADSFYCGLDGSVIFGNEGVPNRRPWKSANFSNMQEMADASAKIHAHGKTVTLTINEHFYTQQQIEQILSFVQKHGALFDGFVVADLGLMLELRNHCPMAHIIASTGAHIQNRNAIEFYQSLNISNIVIPRHFSISEIDAMTENFNDVDFECFMRDGDCANIDGLCRFVHGIFDPDSVANACCSMKNFSYDSLDVPNLDPKHLNKKEIISRYQKYVPIMTKRCGVCAIWDLARMNVSAVKILGREKELMQRVKDVLFVKHALMHAHESRKQFNLTVARVHQRIWKRLCDKQCLYLP